MKLVVVFLAIALLVLGCGGGPAAGSWQGQGISLAWPAGWDPDLKRVMPSPVEPLLGATVLCESQHKKPYGQVVLMTRVLTEGETLQGVFDKTYGELADAHRSTLMHPTSGSTTVSGLPALMESYAAPVGEPFYQYWDVWWESGRRLFVLEGWTYTDFADELHPDFEQMRSGLVMND